MDEDKLKGTGLAKKGTKSIKKGYEKKDPKEAAKK